MKHIKIDDKSRFSCEHDNYVLEYEVPKGDFGAKKGVGFKWEIDGYFPTLEQLLNDWVRNAPSHSNPVKMKELKDVVKILQDAEDHIAKLIKK